MKQTGRSGLHRQRQEVMVHPLEMLANDVKAGIRHQMVNIGNAASHRILDRDHRQGGPPLAHRSKGVLELIARQGCHLGKDMPASEVRISAEGSLEGDRLRRVGPS